MLRLSLFIYFLADITFSFTVLCKLLYVVVTNVLILATFLAVLGFRHGGVSWPYSPRWRQLSDHPCPATHGRDAGAGSDPTSAAFQTAGGQHDAERHPEGPHICCPCTQVGDHCIQQESSQPYDRIHADQTSFVIGKCFHSNYLFVLFDIFLQWWCWACGRVWDHSWDLCISRGAGIWHWNCESQSCGEAEVQSAWDQNSSRWVCWINPEGIKILLTTQLFNLRNDHDPRKT